MHQTDRRFRLFAGILLRSSPEWAGACVGVLNPSSTLSSILRGNAAARSAGGGTKRASAASPGEPSWPFKRVRAAAAAADAANHALLAGATAAAHLGTMGRFDSRSFRQKAIWGSLSGLPTERAPPGAAATREGGAPLCA